MTSATSATIGSRWASGVAAAVFVAAASVGACGGPNRPADLPPVAPTVNIVLREYVIERPTFIPGGRVVFRVHNAGRLNHVLQLFPWPDNLPPIKEQVTRKLSEVHIPSLGGTPQQFPGQTDEFAVDLARGRYVLIDQLPDRLGQSDAAKGMATEFRIPGQLPPALPTNASDQQNSSTTTSTGRIP